MNQHSKSEEKLRSPQGLKPISLLALIGTTEVVPFPFVALALFVPLGAA
jgi:hypothetical protein